MLAAKSCVNGGKSFSDSSNNSNKVSVAVGIRSRSKKALNSSLMSLYSVQ